jgi:DNA-binding transcriptional ArsR family regulator
MTAELHTVVDVAPAAALFADPARARMIAALGDGRALPASVLADEAGVAASTASGHLARLVEGGLVTVEQSGRHRYYALAAPEVAAAMEALSVIAPQRPPRSLRESTRAATLRRARTCYDHLAGRLGVAVTAALLDAEVLIAVDGQQTTGRRPGDPLAAPVPVHPYRLGPNADRVLASLGVAGGVAAVAESSRRPLLRFCVDWTEQRHHLSGALGAAVLDGMRSGRWVRPLPSRRAVELTAAGERGLAGVFGASVLAGYRATEPAR